MWPQIQEALTLRRYTTQTIVNGRPVVQTPTTSTILVSWQPAPAKSTPTTPGYTGPDQRHAWTFAEVLTADEDIPRPADEIVDLDGKVWRVVDVEPWRALGPIPAHWQVVVESVQPLRP